MVEIHVYLNLIHLHKSHKFILDGHSQLIKPLV
jgi:hypothetical protein